MDESERLIERAARVSSSCLLPPLNYDIDDGPIGRDDFTEFRLILDEQLHLLLDILYQNGNLLRDETISVELTELKVNLLLLKFEQESNNPYFQTDQKILINSLASVTNDHIKSFDDKVFIRVIDAYKSSLNKNCWKKQLGKIHSFPGFCRTVLATRGELVGADNLMFFLSIGSNLASHQDPYYKTIGLDVFNCMLEFGDRGLLDDLNISEVIYNESFAMLHKSNEATFIDKLYDCLFHVILNQELNPNTTKWSKYDEVMSELLTQFGMESDPHTSRILLNKVVRICATGKSDQVNGRTLRWLKKLMELMIRESTKMTKSSEDCLTILSAFRSIYISTLLELDPQILGLQLIDFTKKFVIILMIVARTFKSVSRIESEAIAFLETIKSHQSQNVDLVECLQKLVAEIKSN